MDPDANYQEQRQIAQAIQRIEDQTADDGSHTPAQRAELADLSLLLAALAVALDDWIREGGYLPEAWTNPRDRNGSLLGTRTLHGPHDDPRLTGPEGGLWALFVGTANGQGITLHRTREEALAVAAEVLEVDPTDAVGNALGWEDLEARIEDHCAQTADDWHLEQIDPQVTP